MFLSGLISFARNSSKQFKPISFLYYAVQHVQNNTVLKNQSIRSLHIGVVSKNLESTAESASTSSDTPVTRDSPADRSKVVPVETSINYIQSEAYKVTYGSQPVWSQYRRNHKGVFAPKITRKTCIRQSKISTGNPCPICRDEYLVLDYRNTELLRQFISPHNGDVLSYRKTGLCQKRHQELLVAVAKANDVGLITYDVPFREYDYSQYRP